MLPHAGVPYLAEVEGLKSSLTFGLRVSGIVLIAYLLQLLSMDIFPLEFDEGVNILIGHFIQAGYQPYTEISVSHLPLFVGLFGTLWDITAGDMLLSKAIWIGLNTISLISVGYLGRRLLGEKMALLGVAFLVMSTSYLAVSTSITPALLSLLFATLSFLLVSVYLGKANRVWLFLAGCSLAIGILIDLLASHVILVLLLLLMARNSSALRWDDGWIRLSPSWKAFVLDIILLLVGSFFTFIVFSFTFEWKTVYDSTIIYRLSLREAIPFSIQDNLRVLLQFLDENSLLFLGMFVGLVFAQTHAKHVVWFLFIWWMIAAFWVMVQVPSQKTQVAALWAPMALIASWGFYRLSAWSIDGVQSKWERLNQTGISAGHVVGLILVLYAVWNLYQIPGLVNRLQDIRDEEDLRQFQAVPQAVSFLQEITSPDDCVISDDPVLSLKAHRFSPPVLADLSDARIASGVVNLELIEALAIENNCTALVATSHRFKESIPDLTSWAEEFYPRYVNLEGIRIYHRLP